ncbi:hypothetical protein QN391_10290 [Pseudomonas sp. CCI1.2]|uniref:hypothetical protein n=1 Tax=unclassified Pseudomonas TaxID=196821 RepID=UPI002AC8DCCE|nr:MULTISPECIES: hypothetical protein [unclassified Pseudomonas]MEB0091931.1 hypothetical protein [Pseudomonas sp. CCI4.2]MEB0121089.1 hypothetical protein [Pseudomonas sp. CCI1.2]WPX55086.1 hypothetical protein RHM65_05835 [Pseudomonas sp. CCI4.2]
MDQAMNPPSMSETRPLPSRRKGRLQLILVVVVAVGPMVLATGMYKLQFWVPDSRSFHGEMIGNGQSRAELGVQADEQRWQLLVSAPQNCEADCQHLVYLARQLNVGLGQDAARASHGLAAAQPLSADYTAKLSREYPKLERYPLDLSLYNKAAPGVEAPHLWIVDPHGNLVLRYDAKVNGKDLLNDLRQLLKLSNIG